MSSRTDDEQQQQQQQQQPVLIIGAGLAGLSLAIALRTHHVPFHIFERDASPLFRAQGYRIRIQDFYLKQLLPPDLWDKFEKSCPEFVPGGGARLDAMTGRPLGSGGPRPAGPPTGAPGGPPRPLMTEGKPVNVDRRVLRNLMMESLLSGERDHGTIVHFGKRFSKYDTVGDGVVAHFDDGTQFAGRLLVGADGSKSLVRKQLLPKYKVYDTEGRSIFGKTLMNDEIRKSLPEGTETGMSLISDLSDKDNPMRVFCEVMRFTKRDQLDLDLPQDYIYWVLSAKLERLGMPDQQFMRMTGDESLAKALELAKDWNPPCRAIIASQVPDQVSTLSFAIADPELDEDCWPTKTTNPKVTLMGDAAHPMTPVGGVGANAAFLDATLLLKAVVDGAASEDVAGYEDTMRQHARRFIAGSASGATHLFNMKPIEQLKLLQY